LADLFLQFRNLQKEVGLHTARFTYLLQRPCAESFGADRDHSIYMTLKTLEKKQGRIQE